MARRARVTTKTDGVYGAAMRPPAVGKRAASSLSFLQQACGLRAAGGAREAPQEPDTGDSSWGYRKLAFDELLRHMRSRTEDMDRLMTMRREEEGGKVKDAEMSRQTCEFREEWRREREDAAMMRLQEGDRDEVWSESEDAFRAHLECCAHMLVSGCPAVRAGPGQKARRFQELLYAQQMDRILSNIDKQSPAVVIRDAVMDGRARFQVLLTIGVLSNNTPREGSHETQGVDAQSATADPVSDVLHLYENVVAAKASAVASRNVSPDSVKVTPEFALLLQRQRDEAQWKNNEALAQSHHQNLCLRRSVRAFRSYQKWHDYQQTMQSLRRRIRERAARILQLQLLPLCRLYRRVVDAKTRLLYRHQAMKIASYCFWNWIYKLRCGFGTFKFDRQVSDALLHSIIRLQSHYRRTRAARRTACMRATKQIRGRKLDAKMWCQMQANMQVLSDLDADLTEWRYRIGVERERTQVELAKEGERFAAEWAKYEAKLRKDVLKSKLAPEWIPQMDQVSGKQYFLSTKTGRTVKEHPNLLLFKQLVAKQRVRADELFIVQQTRLQDYIAHLDSRLQERTQDILKEMVRRMHHHARATESV